MNGITRFSVTLYLVGLAFAAIVALLENIELGNAVPKGKSRRLVLIER